MVRFVGWLNLNIILKIIVMEHKVLYDTPNGFQTYIYNLKVYAFDLRLFI